MSRLSKLHDEGQSIWLDNIDREMLHNGDLDVARDALGEASELVADAAAELQVPISESGDPVESADADPAASADRR